MLAKDLFSVNDIDDKIQDLIRQLNDLIDQRLEISARTCPLSRKILNTQEKNIIDFSSIDLTIDTTCGLKITDPTK